MSSPIQLGYNVLWLAHPVLQTAVAIALLRRKLHRTFPVFFAYILFQIANFVVLYPINRLGNYEWYFYSYWIGLAISVYLGFRVIHEIFLDVFRPYHTLKDLGTVLFRWAGLVMLLVAIVVAVSSPSGQQSPLTQATLTGERCVRVIQCGLILFLLVFSRYLGISWRQHSFGVALGFGGFASVELSMVAFGVGGHISSTTADLVNMAAYNVAILVWLSYVLVKSPCREAAANLLQTQRWEQTLSDIHHPEDPDSLIPMFEGMVDRALRTSPPRPAPAQREAQPAVSGLSNRYTLDCSVTPSQAPSKP
jgi:hypothetical protein